MLYRDPQFPIQLMIKDTTLDEMDDTTLQANVVISTPLIWPTFLFSDWLSTWWNDCFWNPTFEHQGPFCSPLTSILQLLLVYTNRWGKIKRSGLLCQNPTVLIGFYVETDSSCGQSTREQEIDHWFSLHLPMLPALHQSLHRCMWQQDYIFCCLWQQSQTPCLSLKVTNISFSITTTSFYLCLWTTFDAKLSVWACE